ncbi:MAG: hypothetical protein JO022_21225 [Acidobacteriaceae bacterium]|nr:hypothetical protein [Acidobacteriaceae bacterium]
MRLAALLVCALAAPAEIVDRIAVSVGNQVITEAQIIEELRVTAFLNHEEVQITTQRKREAADRLIEQVLLKRDMEFSHYPPQPDAAAGKLEEQVRSHYPSAQAYAQDVTKYGLTEETLRRHLLWQAAMLSYLEYRFAPSVQISDTEIRQYYDKKRQEWEEDGVEQIPTIEDSRADIEKILTQQRVDQAVDRWLGDTRTQVDIVFRKEAFQ